MRVSVSPFVRGTPLGRRAGLIAVGLLFAGFNTGNNLLYLVFTILASCEVVGFLMAGEALRRIDMEVAAPGRGRVGSPLRFTLRLKNKSRWLPLPALSWRLESEVGEDIEVCTPPVAAGASATGTGRVIPESRGRLEVRIAEAHTDYPVGLVRRTIRLRKKSRRGADVAPLASVLIAPRLKAGRLRLASRRRGDVRRQFHPHGTGEEPLDAREYQAGDDARQIDWKASARTARIMWRDRKGSPPHAVLVRLDRHGPAGASFEERVSRAAGAAGAALDRGDPVAFASDDFELLPRSGPSQRRRIMDYLALVNPLSGAPGSSGSER